MSRHLTMTEINGLARPDFVAVFGGVYEHSPWVAEQVWTQRPFADSGSLAQSMQNAVRESGHDAQLELLRLHPRLGIKTDLTDCSRAEQSGSGLLESTEELTSILTGLNEEYDRNFGFPFIVAVKGLTTGDITARLKERLANDMETEFDEAMCQVFKIAGFRLADIIDDSRLTAT